ncbi:MAG: sulfurtransferase TusA family protein [Nitrospinales bacterium]
MDAKALNIPPEVKREIEEFAAEVERLNRGEIGEEPFKRFRLQQGIYGQRQTGDVQMVRTKLPMGRIDSEKLNCLAEFADTFSNGILHLTTRQDVQFHFVDLQKVPRGLQFLAESGITTREACGNTVRNVTACHKAGTCADEAFDISPYAGALSEYLLRHPLTQNLPRKFKISFGGCNGCGLSPIHDIGFNAVVRNEHGAPTRGFKVQIGGGLGSSPHAAKLLSEFVPAQDILRLAEAILQVFNKHGDKKNRNKARFKFVLDKLGLEKVKELFQQEYDLLADQSYKKIEAPTDSVPVIPKYAVNRAFDADPDFLAWKARNIQPQKQAGFFNIQIKLLLGDLTSEQARTIAQLASAYAAGTVMTTVSQNLMIPWVKEDALGAVFAELKKIGLHQAGTEELRDITCCPGSETCNLGITASRGLATELSRNVLNQYTRSNDLDPITIKTSGCPNSCGQHHIAAIGFHGGAKKINGILAPHYELMLGGRISEGQVVFGTPVIKIPAKNVPKVVRELIDNYKKEKSEHESFVGYFDRQGKAYFANLLEPLKALPSIEEDPQAYIDFGSTEKYSLDDRGQGECAGAVTDMIQDYISSAERALFQAKLALENQNHAEAVQAANRAMVTAARALLVTEGMDFSDDTETLQKFQSLIVDAGIVPEQFTGLLERYQEQPETAGREQAETRMAEADRLVKECTRVYNKLNEEKTLRIRVGSGDDEAPPAKPAGNGAPQQKIDLLGVKCPFNYVKTKIKLETMEPGQIIEVLLDPGEPAENVPKSIRNDGHKVLALDKVDDHFKLVIEKV